MIWTDVVQMFIYILGAGAVAMALLNRIDGGWNEVVRVGMETGRFVWLDTRLDFSVPYTIWAGLLGGVALTLSTHGTDQFLVQRCCRRRRSRPRRAG